MKILMLTSSFDPLTGGAESYMRNLAQGLAARGHDVTVATDGSWLPDVPKDETPDGFRVLRLADFVDQLDRHDRVRWRQLQYCVMDELGGIVAKDFDIVHANSHETVVMAAHISLTFGCPLVASLHEVTPNDSPFGLGRVRLSYEVLPVDAIISGSRFYYERALQHTTRPDRVHHIYNSVPLPVLDGAGTLPGRRELGLPPDRPLVVYPARIHPRKDQLTLVEAVALLRLTVPGIHVVLAGRVSDFGYAQRVREAIAGHGLEDAVVFAENLDNEDMGHLYRAADVVTLPSLQEGLGLAAVEAMSFARPVVVTAVDGLREVVTHEHDGLLVPPQDPKALCEGLHRLLTDPAAAQRMAAEARRTVEARFSQEIMVDKTLAAYDSAARHHASRRSPAAGGAGR